MPNSLELTHIIADIIATGTVITKPVCVLYTVTYVYL